MSGPVPPAGRPGDTPDATDPTAADPTAPDPTAPDPTAPDGGPRHAHPNGPEDTSPYVPAADAPTTPEPRDVPAAPDAPEVTHTQRIPIRTRGAASPDAVTSPGAVTDPDATTQVTPAAPGSLADADTAVLPGEESHTPVLPGATTPAPGTATTATGVAAPGVTPTAEAATAEAPTAEGPTAEAPTPEAPTAETPAADLPAAAPTRRPRDPVLVHLVWEGLLLVVLIGLVVAGLVLFPEFRTVDAGRRVLAAAVFTGIPAMAFSLSLRGAVPNLAVVPLAALGGSVFAASAVDQGLAAGVLQALALTGIVGLVMGALVVGLRVPSWAASIPAGLLAAGLSPVIAAGPEAGLPSAPGFVTADWPLFVVFLVLSVGTGLLCLVPGVRRTLGAYREDVEWGRRGLVAGFVALAVLVVSSAVAGVAGALTVLQTNIAGSSGGAGDLLFPLAAVLLGGASVYGRRVGVAGTVLGVLILVTVRHLWLLSGLGADYAAYGTVYALAGVAAIVGLLATPLVEWAGRRAEARATT